MLKRLAKDSTACVVWTRVTPEGEQTRCNPRMEELFVSEEELRDMHEQSGLLTAYGWCAIVLPADRPRLMQALACAALDRSPHFEVDTTIECMTRGSGPMRCFASVGFHATGPNMGQRGTQLYALRLRPVGHQNLVVPSPMTASGAAAERVVGGARGMGEGWSRSGDDGGTGILRAEQRGGTEGGKGVNKLGRATFQHVKPYP